MKNLQTKKIENTVLLFIFIAPLTIIFYAIFIFNPENMGNPFLYALQVIADIIAIILVGTLWLTILLDLLQSEHHKREINYDLDWLDKAKPKVDVLIPVVNEPLTIIVNTIHEAKSMEYPHEVYVLDDGHSDSIKQIAEDLDVKYIRRPAHEKGYAKSGNLNYALRQIKGDFFAVFDADHAPKKTFLKELLPFFQNEKIALVQSPQHYTNTNKFIAAGTAQAQEVFYKFVQPAKNSYNAAFCVGTNMIYRKSAVEEIGGIYLTDHSEDIWTTIRLHEKGYESVFYNKILAKGRAPETIDAFFRQQNRWAQGGFMLFFTHNPLFIKELSLDQKLQYFFSNIHYFSGIAILIYLILPVIYLLTGEHSMNLELGTRWLIHYIPYFLTVYFLPVFLLGSIKLSTISTAIASFAPYIQAFTSVLFKSDFKWIPTEAHIAKKPILMGMVWLHVLIILVSLLSILVGWYNPQNTTTTAVTSFWVIINSYFLYMFVRQGI